MSMGAQLVRIFDIQRLSTNDGPGIRTTVFFKGCPLRCVWCHNPESLFFQKQVMYIKSLCTVCLSCRSACRYDAILEDLNTDIARCTSCGACVDACHYSARRMCGEDMKADILVDELMRDNIFFQESGGGVSISGGEPFFQSAGLDALVTGLKARQAHVAIDTSGYTDSDMFIKICNKADLVLFDIKHMDDSQHKRITGVGNQLILKNFTSIVKMGVDVIVRYPMIKGKNDDPDNLKRMASFLRKNGIDTLEVIPYHDIGENKYKSIGLQREKMDFRNTDEEIREKVRFLYEEGLKIRII